jgi:hypothetical protein
MRRQRQTWAASILGAIDMAPLRRWLENAPSQGLLAPTPTPEENRPSLIAAIVEAVDAVRRLGSGPHPGMRRSAAPGARQKPASSKLLAFLATGDRWRGRQ